MTLRCAVYVRRSTEEHQHASLDVQTAEASTYIAKKGWVLDPNHVYVDDGISRAEFQKRQGLIRMMVAAEKGKFDIVITRDETRIGGDMVRTGLTLQTLTENGVRVFYYYTDEEVRTDDPTSKLMMMMRNYTSEVERAKVSQRTHEHLLSKARRGFHVGGRCYGYKNVPVMNGEIRTHVVLEIDAAEAEVMRTIFMLYANHEGPKAIAKDLNRRGVRSPRAGARGTGSWSPSAVHAMLRNERYRGFIEWNKRQKTYKHATKVRIDRQESQWVRVETPHLRIVDEALWDAVQRRIAKTALSSVAIDESDPDTTRVSARSGRPPKYLLSQLGRCAECGGPISVANGRSGKRNIKVYGCNWHRTRGTCANSLRRPVETVNAAVVDWVAAHVLTEQVVLQVLGEVDARLREQAANGRAGLAEKQKEAASVKDELDRLVNAIASGEMRPKAIMGAIAERQRRINALDAEIRAARQAPEAIAAELKALRETARSRIRDLRSVLDRNPGEARDVMRALFEESLRFTPIDDGDGPRYRVTGTASIRSLLDVSEGGLSKFTNLASPAGFEPALQA